MQTKSRARELDTENKMIQIVFYIILAVTLTELSPTVPRIVQGIF